MQPESEDEEEPTSGDQDVRASSARPADQAADFGLAATMAELETAVEAPVTAPDGTRVSAVSDPPDGAALQPGTVLEGAYQIRRMIGRGGMGAVYEADHMSLGRSFAIKVVIGQDVDSNSALRLVQEARTASALEHENIIDVTHLGRDDELGLAFVVMELLRGEDLQDALERQVDEGETPFLPDARIRELAAPMLSALAAAHDAGVIHRDLKPANVFLARKRDGREVLKVLDFGMSKLSHDESAVKLTRTGQIIGTPLYMSPEQSRSFADTDARSDVYALGVMLYEMLAGQVPFPCDSVYSCLIAHVQEPPPPLQDRRPDLPPAVIAVVHHCLEKDPDARYPDGRALLHAWEAAWGDEAAQAAVAASLTPPPPAPAPPAEPEPERSGVPVLAIAGAVLALAVVGGVLAVSLSGETPEEATTVRSLPAEAPAEPEPVREPTPDPAPAEVAVREILVRSTPPGAEIREGDDVVGVTPMMVEVSLGDAPRSLTLTLDRHRPEEVTVNPAMEGDALDVRMTRLRRPPTKRRGADDLAEW